MSLLEALRSALDNLVARHGQPESARGAQPTGWDEAVQLYLAIVALDGSAGAINVAEFNATRELFSFPENYDSPRGFLGQRPPVTLPGSQTPSTYPRSRQRIVDALVKLIQQLEPIGN